MAYPQKITHFYCRPCAEYHPKTHPHFRATKRRALKRRIKVEQNLLAPQTCRRFICGEPIDREPPSTSGTCLSLPASVHRGRVICNGG